MARNLFAISLIGILTITSGCSMCSSCTDEAPNYRGGLRGHEDMRYGRVGSAFTNNTEAEEGAAAEGKTSIESNVYAASHEEAIDAPAKSSLRQAGLTKKDLESTAVKLIATESMIPGDAVSDDMILGDADFRFEN